MVLCGRKGVLDEGAPFFGSFFVPESGAFFYDEERGADLLEAPDSKGRSVFAP